MRPGLYNTLARLPALAGSLLRMIALIACGSVLAVPVVQAQQSRILAIGDSITHGFGNQCSYRKPLSEKLKAIAGCDVAFVGPQGTPQGNPQACKATNTRHAGYSGWRADQFVADDDRIGGFMSDYAPDYVLLHVGSNDINQGDGVSDAVADIDEIITRTFLGRPSAKIMLANVIPWDPTTFDNATVDELAQTAELSAALNALASERRQRGDAVFLVDVAKGFDPEALTIDGVHPNDAGEELLASRFLASLNSEGICGAPPVQLPALTLANDTWAQISLPGDPGEKSTVADIFDELPKSEFSNTWTVFSAKPSDAEGLAYKELSLNSRLRVGQAYWVIQRSGKSVLVRMPENSTPVASSAVPGCAPGKACFEVPVQASSGKVMWNFVGYPFPAPASAADTRVVTGSGGCEEGCTLDESYDNDVSGPVMFHYDENATNGYRQVRSSDSINAWDGLWLPVLPTANGLSPKLLFGR